MKILNTFLLAIILVSCSQVNTTKDAANFDIPFFRDSLKFLDYNAQIISDIDGQALSVNSKLRIAGIDSISMSLLGPFNISLGKFYSNNENFLFYNSMENKAFTGTPSKENFRQTVRINLSYHDLISFLRSEVPTSFNTFKMHKTLENKDKLFQRKNDDGIEYMLLDQHGKIKQYQQLANTGDPVLNILFSDYTEIESNKFATFIIFKFLESKSKVTFKIKDIKIKDNHEKSYSFTLPNSVKTINLN